jgi:uncharacterized membrane protein
MLNLLRYAHLLFVLFGLEKMNVLIAGVFGVFVFTMLAFFLEYLRKQEAKKISRNPNLCATMTEG